MIEAPSPAQRERWSRGLDLISLAAGEDNDCQMAGQACAAVPDAERTLMLSIVVGLAASLADCIAAITGRDVHDVLHDFR